MKNQHLKDMEVFIASYKAQFEAVEAEAEARVENEGILIVDRSIAKFHHYFDTVTKKAENENARLKAEINRQHELAKEIQKDIDELGDKNKLLKQQNTTVVDPRRNVLRLKDFMTCTPEMDVLLPIPNVQ